MIPIFKCTRTDLDNFLEFIKLVKKESKKKTRDTQEKKGRSDRPTELIPPRPTGLCTSHYQQPDGKTNQ